MIPNPNRADSSTFQQLVDELLTRGLGFRFQAKGRSMFPTIQDGDVVHVVPVDRSSLKAGDVIFFRSGGLLKAHRIVRRKGKTFVTRGDASLETDHELCSAQIVGKVIAKECRESGGVTSFNGAGSRMRFFAAELRRSMAIRSKLERLLAQV